MSYGNPDFNLYPPPSPVGWNPRYDWRGAENGPFYPYYPGTMRPHYRHRPRRWSRRRGRWRRGGWGNHVPGILYPLRLAAGVPLEVGCNECVEHQAVTDSPIRGRQEEDRPAEHTNTPLAAGFRIPHTKRDGFYAAVARGEFPLAQLNDPRLSMYKEKKIPIYIVPWEQGKKYKPDNVAESTRFRHPVIVEKLPTGTIAVFYFLDANRPFGNPQVAFLARDGLQAQVLDNIANLMGARTGVVGHRKARAQAHYSKDTETMEAITVNLGADITLRLHLLRLKTDRREYPIRDQVRAHLIAVIQKAWNVVREDNNIAADKKQLVFPREIIEAPPNRSVLGENDTDQLHTLVVARKNANLDAIVDAEGILAVLLHEIAHSVALPEWRNASAIVFGKAITRQRIDHGDAFHLALGHLLATAVRIGYIPMDSRAGEILTDHTKGFNPTAKIYRRLIAGETVNDTELRRFSKGANGQLKKLFRMSADFLVGAEEEKDDEGGEGRMEVTQPSAEGDAGAAGVAPATKPVERTYFWIDPGEEDDVAAERTGPKFIFIDSDEEDSAAAQATPDTVLMNSVRDEANVSTRSKKNQVLYNELTKKDPFLYGRAVLCLNESIAGLPRGRIDLKRLRKGVMSRCTTLVDAEAKKLINQELFARPRKYGVRYSGKDKDFENI